MLEERLRQKREGENTRGVFDNLEILADIAKDIVSLPFQIGKEITELGNDIVETIGQDVQHKLEGTADKPLRTSYDIKREAEQTVERSQKEYWNAQDRLVRTWESTKTLGKGGCR